MGDLTDCGGGAGGMLVGSAVKATGNALGAIASTSGSLLSGAGSAIGKGASGLADAGGKVFDKLGIDTTLEPEQLQGDVVTALKKAVSRHYSLNSCNSS